MTNKTCVALGYFDGVHVGHKTVINAALALKQFEPAVFTFNNRESGNITTDDTKKKLISELGIGRIFSYDFERIKDYSPERFVSEVLLGELGAGSVCCGYDFRFGKGRTADADELTKICEKLDIETIVVPPVEVGGVAVSSTLIRELIIKGDAEQANILLGYELSYELMVVGGNKLGRTIGFPTINQNIPQELVIPRYGVYKSRVAINGNRYGGLTNIGVKPTAGGHNKPLAETHIIGYNEDLYGEKIKISLLNFIRPEKKFNDFTELSEQIKQDLRTAQM